MSLRGTNDDEDVVLDYMRRKQIPMTKQNYDMLTWFGSPPDGAEYPRAILDAPPKKQPSQKVLNMLKRNGIEVS